MPAGQNLMQVTVGLLRILHFALRAVLSGYLSFWNITPTVLHIPIYFLLVGLMLVWKRNCYYDLTCRSFFVYTYLCH